MANVGKITLGVEIKRYCILFFPVAKYERCEDVAVLTVLGLPVRGRMRDQTTHLFKRMA